MKGTSLVIKSKTTSIIHDPYNFTKPGAGFPSTKGQFALQDEKSGDFSGKNLYNICTIIMVHDVANLVEIGGQQSPTTMKCRLGSFLVNLKLVINPGIQYFRNLLEFVQCFLQSTDMRLLLMNYKAFWLLHVHFFLNYPIKKYRLYIHLM